MSRVITEPDFNSVPGLEIKTYEGAYPIPLRTIYAQRTIGLDSDVLHELVPFIQFENVKNTHGGVLLLVKSQAKSLYLCQK